MRIGSIKEANKEPVAIHTKQIETFEYLILPKNKTQCVATIIPIPIILKISFQEYLGICFQMDLKNNKLTQVNNNLHHTKAISSKEITFPRIAVNPQRNTATCNSRYDFLILFKEFDFVKILIKSSN